MMNHFELSSCCFAALSIRPTGEILLGQHEDTGCSTSSSHWKKWPHKQTASLVSTSLNTSVVYPPPSPSLSLFPFLHPFLPTTLTHPPPLSLSRCKLRGLSSLKALTPVALIAAAVAPTLAAWMAMNISSGGEEERGVRVGRGRLGRGAKQVRMERVPARTSRMGGGRGRRKRGGIEEGKQERLNGWIGV